MIHITRVDWERFELLSNGKAEFIVIRKNRFIRVGDLIAVNEFIADSSDPYEYMQNSHVPENARRISDGWLTGNSLLFEITCIVDSKEYCKDGMAILGLKKLEVREGKQC